MELGKGAGRRGSAVAVVHVVVVEVTTSGLRQATPDHVADRQERDQLPRLGRAEAAVTVDDGRGDQDADDGAEVGDELGRVDRCLGLGTGTARVVPRSGVGGVKVGAGHHWPPYGLAVWYECAPDVAVPLAGDRSGLWQATHQGRHLPGDLPAAALTASARFLPGVRAANWMTVTGSFAL